MAHKKSEATLTSLSKLKTRSFTQWEQKPAFDPIQ